MPNTKTRRKLRHIINCSKAVMMKKNLKSSQRKRHITYRKIKMTANFSWETIQDRRRVLTLKCEKKKNLSAQNSILNKKMILKRKVK